MKKIEIEVPTGKNAKWVNGVLTLVDDVPKDITERIKTLEDACNELGDTHAYVRLYSEHITNLHDGGEDDADVVAYLKLRIICAALNEGWQPQFPGDEYRYYPLLCLYTREEYDELDEDANCRVVCRGGDNVYACSGRACAVANNVSSVSYASFGSRLAFKTHELAEYAGRQFVEIFADFCFMPKDK
ncbi:MAG: hypothetical protein RSA66_10445 [Muribaculaceae bacterium]